MKKVMICFFVAISVIFYSAVSMATEKVEINDALKKGLISITIFARARGEMAELRVKRLSATPLIVIISKGRTDIAGEVSVLSEGDKEIDLSSKYEESIVLRQTGSDRFTRRPVTVDASSVK